MSCPIFLESVQWSSVASRNNLLFSGMKSPLLDANISQYPHTFIILQWDTVANLVFQTIVLHVLKKINRLAKCSVHAVYKGIALLPQPTSSVYHHLNKSQKFSGIQ